MERLGKQLKVGGAIVWATYGGLGDHYSLFVLQKDPISRNLEVLEQSRDLPIKLL